MHLFALLNLPVAFDVDLPQVEAAYFKAQRQFHPDRFIGKPAAERHAALQASIDINNAYKILINPLTRAQALLAMQHITVGTDNDSVKPSQSLLMETLEWREAIDDSQSPESLKNREDALSQAHLHCLAALSGLYREQNWPEMAQQTLRLGYIEKSLQAVAQKKTRKR